jgi:hypothetical protein
MKALRFLFFGMGCLSLFAAVALLIVPAAYTYFMSESQANSAEVTGEVISMRQDTQWSSDQNRNVTYYCPTVEYTTLDGETFSFDSINCSTPPMYQTGDPIQVVYSLDDPQNAYVKSDLLNALGLGTAWSVGALGVCSGIFGVIAIVLGIIVGRRHAEPTREVDPGLT